MANNQNKIGLGKICEKWLFAMLSALFKAKEGYKVTHVDWQKYNYGFGVDLKVFEKLKSKFKVSKENKRFGKPKIRLKPLFHFECKNWRLFNRPYGTQVVLDEMIDRFDDSKAKFKVLVISFKSLISKKGLELLRKHNIHVFEVGKLVGKMDFPRRKCSNSKFFHKTKNRVANFLNSIKKQAERVVYKDIKYHRFINNNRNRDNIDNNHNNTLLIHDTQYQPNSVIQFVFSFLNPKQEGKIEKML